MNDPLSLGFGVLLLLCSFGLLACRRPAQMIALYRAEAAILTTAVFWQGHLQSAAALYLIGGITLAGKALLLPRLLRRLARRSPPLARAAPTFPVGLSVLFGLGLLGLAMLVLPPPARAGLLNPLAVVLLGLLLLTTRRDPLSQAIGFLSIENGAMLAAVTVPGLPLVAVLAVMSLLLAAALPAGLVLFGPPNDGASLQSVVRPGK